MKKKIRILIVDDDQATLVLIKEIFRSYGWEASTISNPHEVMRLLKSKKFDLLITDIRMPKGDGYKLIRRVRRIFPEFPIIILTAYDTYKVHDFAKALNVQEILLKPIKIWEFVFTIAKILNIEEI